MDFKKVCNCISLCCGTRGNYKDPGWCCFMNIPVFIDILCTKFQMLLLWASSKAFLCSVFVVLVHMTRCFLIVCISSKLKLEYFFLDLRGSAVALLWCPGLQFTQKQGATSSGAKRSESIGWGEEIRWRRGRTVFPFWLDVVKIKTLQSTKAVHTEQTTALWHVRRVQRRGVRRLLALMRQLISRRIEPIGVSATFTSLFLSCRCLVVAVEPDEKTAGRLSVP